MRSIIIAFSNPLLSEWVKTILLREGYNIEYSCKTGAELIRVADFCTSMVVVSGFQFADMTAEGLQTALNGRLAMVTVVLPHQDDLITREDMVVISYPLGSIDLIDAIERAEKAAAAEAALKGFRPAGKEYIHERSAEEKLLILQAKKMLMDRYQMTESQAHRFLQKSSMDRGLKLIQAARMVIDDSFAM
ncbi:ANTAR domain-containing protein [Brucepastera parasyntrophica]|uniref:ANTAR domain-containing response regulator n=1 Tax=Brucepastera parasyntrophica TaxID=2880008 RepID=UPI00210A5057|nr:ANTAR domain-containing protein [Brucepastera parasyntrophica]ULQ60584.1 ANTAR domain-containing protein [Brucepastera parasyntrophica]